MLATAVSIAASLAIGFLLGGCAGRDEISQSLLQRNAQLENQIASQQSLVTGLTAALILMSCSLAGSLLWRSRKGGRRSAPAKPSSTPP